MEDFKPVREDGVENRKRFLKALKIISLSVLTMQPMSLKAQLNNPKNINEKTFEIHNPLVVKDKNYQETQRIATEDRDWLIEYISSPQYKERMMREFLIWKSIGQDHGSQDFTKSKYFVENVTSLTKVEDPGNVVIDTILNRFRKISQKDLVKSYPLESIFPTIDVANLSNSEDSLEVDKLINDRISMIKSTPWVIIPNIYFPKKTYGYFFPADNPVRMGGWVFKEGQVVFLAKKLPENGKTVPVHEFNHVIEDKENLAIPSTKTILEIRNLSKNPYYREHFESKARIGAFRRELQVLGIYNPFTDDFTKEHLEKYRFLIKEGKIKKEFGARQLMDSFSDEDIIWFMNNTAGIDLIEIIDDLDKDYQKNTSS